METSQSRSVLPLLVVSALLFAACGSSDLGESAESAGEAPPHAELVVVPGTGVRLAPPAGFTPAVDFPGFIHAESTTSIMVTEMPAPFAEVALAFRDKGQLARKGMTLLESEERRAGDHPGLLVRISQSLQGIAVEKWGWVFGTPEKTVLLMGTCLDVEYLSAVRDSILTATWDPNRVFDVAEGLGFELTDTRGLTLWKRIANALVYTSDGEPDFEQVGKPFLTISPGLGSGIVEDKRAFVEQSVQQLSLNNIEVQKVDSIEIDGLEGLALVATAEQKDTGAGRFIYQVILFDVDNYWIGVGIAALKYEQEFLLVFRRAVSSLLRADAAR